MFLRTVFNLVIASFLILPHISWAQSISAEPEKVATYAEHMPRFVAADSTNASLMNYLARNVRYPVEALRGAATGTVFVTFVVNREGRTEQIQTTSKAHKSLQLAARDVVANMPAWQQPGTNQGQPVPVQLTVPVRFNIGTAGMKNTTIAGLAGQPDTAPVFEADPLGAVHYLQQVTSHLKCPKGGLLLLALVVQPDGTVGSPEIMLGISPEIDGQVLCLLQQMPHWKPATKAGQPIAVPLRNIPLRIMAL